MWPISTGRRLTVPLAACLTAASISTTAPFAAGSYFVRFVPASTTGYQQIISCRGTTHDLEILMDGASAGQLNFGDYASSLCKTGAGVLAAGAVCDAVCSWVYSSSTLITITCWVFQNGQFVKSVTGNSFYPTAMGNPVSLG